jgi:hypothetical protein
MADAQAASAFAAKPQDPQTQRPPQELTSILTQVQSLQSDRERLLRELEEARVKVDKLQVPPRAATRYFPNLTPSQSTDARPRVRRRASARR